MIGLKIREAGRTLGIAHLLPGPRHLAALRLNFPSSKMATITSDKQMTTPLWQKAKKN